MRAIDLGPKKIGIGQPAFIVAEISANHNQDYKKAVALVKKAAKTGVDAVKFQVYTPDTITTDSDNQYFQIKHPKWGGQTLYELYSKGFTPWEWLPKLKREAEKIGLIFFASAFDNTSIDYLEEMNVCMHKISSFELNDLPLIAYAARTKKPLVLSTGMASFKEISDAVKTARKAGAEDIILLRCVSSYPAPANEMCLSNINDMARRFDCLTGLSDHTLGTAVSVASVALGGVFIEKHFTDTRKRETPDSFFSMEPKEFKNLVNDVRTVEQAIGRPTYKITEKEQMTKVFRRSLFAVQDILKGERITEVNVRSIRPAHGLETKNIDKICRMKAAKNIKKGTPIDWALLSKGDDYGKHY